MRMFDIGFEPPLEPPKEPELPRCPICGAYPDAFFFRAYNRECIGCSDCVEVIDDDPSEGHRCPVCCELTGMIFVGEDDTILGCECCVDEEDAEEVDADDERLH